MSNYTPGEGYDKGYQNRLNGGQLPSQAVGGSSDPYWQEYATGWRDADTKIIAEARDRNGYIPKRCCKNNRFIQD